MCTAIPFLYGNFVVASQVPQSVIVLAVIVFIAIIGREIIKSIQDMKGDARYGRRTLPIKIGARKSSYIAAFLVLVAVALSFVPFFYLPLFQHDLYYIAPVLLCDFLWLYSVALVLKLKELKKIRNITQVAQLFGVLGFLLGALF